MSLKSSIGRTDEANVGGPDVTGADLGGSESKRGGSHEGRGAVSLPLRVRLIFSGDEINFQNSKFFAIYTELLLW